MRWGGGGGLLTGPRLSKPYLAATSWANSLSTPWRKRTRNELVNMGWLPPPITPATARTPMPACTCESSSSGNIMPIASMPKYKSRHVAAMLHASDPINIARVWLELFCLLCFSFSCSQLRRWGNAGATNSCTLFPMTRRRRVVENKGRASLDRGSWHVPTQCSLAVCK